MKVPDKLLKGVGHTYNALYKIPGVGEPIVRGMSKSVAFLNSHMPGARKGPVSIDEFKKGFAQFGEMVGLEYDTGAEDEQSIVVLVHRCPYGWDKPEQHGVCDAAMDMDRKMVGYSGLEMLIQERIVDGAPACKLLITRK